MSGSTTGTLQLRPFRGVRFAAHTDLAQVIAPPYDVIDDAQQRALEASDQHNIVRVILPREPVDGSTDRYTSAAHLFEHWLSDGVVVVDDTPALYVYQQTREGVVIQRGLVGAVVMQPLDGGVILPHENVRVGPVEDRLALTSTYLGLILPYVGTSLPFTILLLAAYFESFPRDLEDAARVDGCNEIQVFLRVVLPLARGPMTAVAILLANGFWGEFLYSLVLMPDNAMKTLPVGLFEFTAEHFTPINLVLAGVGVIVTPILIVYVLFQRQITGANLEIVRG